MPPKKSKTKPTVVATDVPLTPEELRNARRDGTLKAHRLGVRVVRSSDSVSGSGQMPIAAVPLRSVGPSEVASTSVGEGDVAPEPPLTEREKQWDSPNANGGLRHVVPFLP